MGYVRLSSAFQAKDSVRFGAPFMRRSSYALFGLVANCCCPVRPRMPKVRLGTAKRRRSMGYVRVCPVWAGPARVDLTPEFGAQSQRLGSFRGAASLTGFGAARLGRPRRSV
eukprot:GEMP01074617.1.p1 GENE.GEMP01074617.1~~GEMP01074617.1.p1  ORF type:complete len:112 (+),score=6.93 GEMP01074617.1:103-438(+)